MLILGSNYHYDGHQVYRANEIPAFEEFGRNENETQAVLDETI